jgi:hypothetical protein
MSTMKTPENPVTEKPVPEKKTKTVDVADFAIEKFRKMKMNEYRQNAKP